MRYSRQTSLIGKTGQNKLQKSHVTIIGLGAIGSVAAELLARAGVGQLTLIDRDIIEEHNLPRQSLYTETDVGTAKAVTAKTKLEAINSAITITAHLDDLDQNSINKLIQGNLILDCTDNFATRYLLNDYCKQHNRPWVYAGAIEQKAMIMPILSGQPCFACVFPDKHTSDTCDTIGVLNTATHFAATLQVNYALKILLEEDVSAQLITINLKTNTFETLNIQQHEDCKVCQGVYEHLESKADELVKLCGTGTYQVKQTVNLKTLKPKLEQLGNVKDLGYCLFFDKLTIFNNRVLIKAQNKEQAKSLVAQYIGS